MIMSDKVLIIDDEELIREEVRETLEDCGYRCVEAASASEALEMLRQDTSISIAIVDIRMPGMDGLTMMRKAIEDKQINHELEFVVTSGHGSTQERIDSLQKGAVEFLQKPFDFLRLIQVVERAQELVNQNRSKRYFEEMLNPNSPARTAELEQLCKNVDGSYQGVMDHLLHDSEYNDPAVGQHIHHIGEYAAFIAEKLDWSEERQQKIRLAAPLHDIGKLGTPESILSKPQKLSKTEWSMMQQHPAIGYRILSQSQQPVMQMAANIALQHHERWDGSGYPLGLKGNMIAPEASIVALVDIYDALRREKPYKPAFDHSQTVDIILNGDDRTRPEHFSSDTLNVFKAHTDHFDRLYELTNQ